MSSVEDLKVMGFRRAHQNCFVELGVHYYHFEIFSLVYWIAIITFSALFACLKFSAGLLCF